MVPKKKNNQRIPSGYFSFAEYQNCCEVIKELKVEWFDRSVDRDEASFGRILCEPHI